MFFMWNVLIWVKNQQFWCYTGSRASSESSSLLCAIIFHKKSCWRHICMKSHLTNTKINIKCLCSKANRHQKEEEKKNRNEINFSTSESVLCAWIPHMWAWWGFERMRKDAEKKLLINHLVGSGEFFRIMTWVKRKLELINIRERIFTHHETNAQTPPPLLSTAICENIKFP